MISESIAKVRAALAEHVFRVTSEAMLQDQVSAVLARVPGAWLDREVGVRGGRFDIMIEVNSVVLVVELKLHASASAVERQAQRYAKIDEVDAVVVVTTSQRLGAELRDLDQLGGKPFAVIALRTT